MRVVILNSHYDDDLASEQDVLERYASTASWAANLV